MWTMQLMQNDPFMSAQSVGEYRHQLAQCLYSVQAPLPSCKLIADIQLLLIVPPWHPQILYNILEMWYFLLQEVLVPAVACRLYIKKVKLCLYRRGRMSCLSAAAFRDSTESRSSVFRKLPAHPKQKQKQKQTKQRGLNQTMDLENYYTPIVYSKTRALTDSLVLDFGNRVVCQPGCPNN